MTAKQPQTIVYVDGFNLYYGCLKNTSYKWLNVVQLCRLLLPQNNIVKVKYFTAKINSRANDPHQRTRQETYLQALQTLPEIEIIYGHFLTTYPKMPIHPITTPVQKVQVVKTEEKGSDVNLATHLLMDGFQNQFEVAALITNDSDLLLPIQVVRQTLQKPVGILNPHQHPSHQLQNNCDFVRKIRGGVLNASQFSTPIIISTNGEIHKPVGW